MHEDELLEGESVLKDFLEDVKDAVLGVSDELVEVLSVATGLAGAHNNTLNVALGRYYSRDCWSTVYGYRITYES